MVIVLIRTALREPVDLAAYEQTGARMDALVRTIPGFVSVKDYVAEDGERISMVCFESQQALAAWREHPEHVIAQRAGKTQFYASYDIRVCEVVRAYDFEHADPAGG
jgi:heme-degrading monooxygenase HmoA